MPSWKHDADRALDAELRAARPEPGAGVTRAIADQVRARPGGLKHRAKGLQIAVAAGVAALAVAGMGVVGSAAIAEYGDVTICVLMPIPHTQTVSPAAAAVFVNGGFATYGPCP